MSQHCLSFLKASVWKITSIWWLGGAVTLFVMDVKVALSSRLWKRLEKTRRVEQKGGGIDRVCVQKKKKKAHFSHNLAESMLDLLTTFLQLEMVSF